MEMGGQGKGRAIAPCYRVARLVALWGNLLLSFLDDPTQQVYDIVVSLIAGALIGYAAYSIKQRRRSGG